ncbi:unnamed protein product [Brassica rapa subsp. trilocularis]
MGGASFYVGGSTIWDGGSLDGFSLVRNLCFAAVTVRRYMWSLGPRRKVQAFGAVGRLYGWCFDGQAKEHAWFLDTSAP